MNDSLKAFLSALSIMAFLSIMTFFASTVSAKASQKVKTLVENEVKSPLLPKKTNLPKHSPVIIPMSTSINEVKW